MKSSVLHSIIVALAFIGCTAQTFPAPSGYQAASPSPTVSSTPTPYIGEVHVSTDLRNYSLGNNVKVVIRNGLSQAIFLPGCNQFSVESCLSSVPVETRPLKQCVWEGFAQKVESGGVFVQSFDSTPLETPSGEGYYGINVNYAIGCGERETFGECTAKPSTTESVVGSVCFTLKAPVITVGN